MKHIALTGLFAVSLVAQGQEAARPKFELEIAAAIAAETQERDLPKAERLYRAAIADQALSKEARRYARYRLAGVLRMLGRNREAREIAPDAEELPRLVAQESAQDRERRAELRNKARELVREIVATPRRGMLSQSGGAFFGMTRAQADRLQWIGAPAVPEVIAALQQQMAEPDGGDSPASRGLVQFLWNVGGPRAERFLIECARDDVMQGIAADCAGAIRVIDIDAPVLRAYLDHEDWAIVRRLLQGGPIQGGFVQSFGGMRGILARLDAEQMLALAERGPTGMKAAMLRELPGRSLTREQLARAHALVEQAISGTDPEFGKAAELFLCSTESQQSSTGLVRLVERLPDLQRRNVPIAPWHDHRRQVEPRRFSRMDTDEIVAKLDGAARRMDRGQRNNAVSWAESLMAALVEQGDDATVAAAIGWWDLGFDLAGVLLRHISKQNAVALLQRYDALAGASARSLTGADPSVLGWFRPEHMSPEALPVLAELAAREDLAAERGYLVALMGATGDPAAVDHVLAFWREESAQVYRRPGGGWVGKSSVIVAEALVALAATDSVRVRDAIVQVLHGKGDLSPDSARRSSLMLSLMSAGDVRALDLLVEQDFPAAVTHASGRGIEMTPWVYLVIRDPEPPHGFTRAQIVATMARRAPVDGDGRIVMPDAVPLDRLDDDLLVEFARRDYRVMGRTQLNRSWQEVAYHRLVSRLQEGGDVAVLDSWFRSALGKPSTPSTWLTPESASIGRRYATELLAVLDGPDENWAYRAMRCLLSAEGQVDTARLLRNRHAAVRRYAMSRVRHGDFEVAPELVVACLADRDAEVRADAALVLGAMVHEDAVPGLIGLLRDADDRVRQNAADALTRIRFYHEQKAHWDRVLKGLDASPQSAVEKLLLQAKPGEPKEQRLLAIASLGVLGMPEALPFLIEWSTDADRALAGAARDAIKAIHRRPRK